MNVDNVTKSAGKNAESKKGVAKTKISYGMEDLGYAARELFVQFLVRIQKELPNATIAMFSTLKYVNAPNFSTFRERWDARYLGGFVVHSRAFDGLKGNFPIGFLQWDLSKKDPAVSINTKVLNKVGHIIGEHTFYRREPRRLLSEWIVRPRSNKQEAVPLKSALSPTVSTKDVRGSKWANGAVGSMIVFGNDLQHSGTGTALLSSGYGNAGAFFVTPDNLWKAAVVFAVRMVIPHTWFNHNDQFLQPSSALPDSFKTDCLIYMLFSGKNMSAGADGLEWNGKTWSLVNHFIPFSEGEVKASGRFESDFMRRYIAKLKLSPEATAVLNEGRKLWRRYNQSKFGRTIREQFKLNRPDAGWYQVRQALQANAQNEVVDFEPFRAAYKELGDKLRPQVFEYGFLPE